MCNLATQKTVTENRIMDNDEGVVKGVVRGWRVWAESVGRGSSI